ncbi:hypothetical protein S40288_11605 [Stachybotrys chartarum IBT 40288]|nr:hypothetical protein S40288_11605 [Stachybotrys chartarum IBT 40288]
MVGVTRLEWLNAKIGTDWVDRRWMMWKILMIMLAIELPPTGLTANAITDFNLNGRVPNDQHPMMIIVVTVAGFAEVVWIAITACVLTACGLHFIFFLSIAIIAVSSFGTGVFALVAMGISMANSVCDNDVQSPDRCEVGLRKGLAAGCYKILLT